VKLFFEELKIKNWGPFVGTNEIDFSISKEKNVIYIYGLNSSGKTNIFEALYWCLFNFPSVNDLTNIINKIALKNNDKEMSVRAKFYTLDDYQNRTDYDITRLVKYDIIQTEQNGLMPTMITSFFNGDKYIQISSKPIPLSQDEFHRTIDKFIPEGPRPFFFLDGEKLADLFKKENILKIESYANALSDISLIDKLIENLDNLYEKLDSKYKVTDDVEIKKLSNAVEESRANLEKAKEWKNELQKKLIDAEKLERELKVKCEGFEKIKPILDNIKKFESELNGKKVRYDEKFKDLKEFLNDNVTLLLLSDKIDECIISLNELEKEGKIPPKVPPEILNEILKNTAKECICGRPIDDEIKRKFEEILTQIPSEKLNQTIQDFRSELGIKNRNIKGHRTTLETKLDSISKLNIDINGLNTKIHELRAVMPPGVEKKGDEIFPLFKRWNEVTEEIVDLANQVSRADDSITLAMGKLDDAQYKYESKLSKNTKMKELGQKLEYVRNAKKFSELVKLKVKSSIINFVKENTSTIFTKLIWDPSNWVGIHIDEDWCFTAISSSGEKLPCYRLSKGQQHVLGIAFMSSLGKVTGNLIPFVFDSPFGRVSEDPIEKIGKILPSMMEGRQVILFVTDTEDKNIRPHIKNLIAKKYILDKISAFESELRGE